MSNRFPTLTFPRCTCEPSCQLFLWEAGTKSPHCSQPLGLAWGDELREAFALPKCAQKLFVTQLTRTTKRPNCIIVDRDESHMWVEGRRIGCGVVPICLRKVLPQGISYWKVEYE